MRPQNGAAGVAGGAGSFKESIITSESRYPMNPADYVLLAKHESLQRRGYSGLNVMLLAEARGELPPEAMRRALKQLGSLYPALSARVRYSPIAHRPSWRIPANADLENAVEYSHVRCASDGEEAWQPLQSALDDSVNVRAGRQLRLIHSQIGEDFHRLAIRWAHPLMDMEGGHWVLRVLNDLLNNATPALGNAPFADEPSPFPMGPLSSALLAWQGRWLYATYDSYRQPRIIKKPENATKRCRFLARTYDASRRQRFQELAAKRVSTGPLRYSRATIIGLARAYLKMSTERGRPREHYLFPFPLPVPRPGPRPGIHGNYVTIPFVVFKSEDLADWGLADAEASRQLGTYHEKRHDAAMWCMYRAASRWPVGLTSLLTTHRRPRAAAGYTGYQFDNSVTRLGSAVITNLFGAGAMDCHPGWLLGRTTFADAMGLSITYFEDYFDTASVREFFDLLECELFDEVD